MKTKAAVNNPIATFDEIWNLFRTTYSGFKTKGIDWKNLYEVYKTKVTEATAEEELFTVVTSMLKHLNDPHVQVRTLNSEKHFFSGTIGSIIEEIGFNNTMQMFTSRPLPDSYFTRELHVLDTFSYAWLEGNIGYFHFGEFGDLEKTKETMEKIINFFSSSRGLIIDIRRNIGGDDRVGKLIADCFADKKREYMITSTKNGAGHNDYSDKKVWAIEPNGYVNYQKPVMVLTDKTTFSAAENFALAMRELPHVKLVGDFTTGGFSDADWKTLSCGWEVCIPFGIFTDKNGFCWEGIGIPPNYMIRTDPAKQMNGTDELIELSMSLINSI